MRGQEWFGRYNARFGFSGLRLKGMAVTFARALDWLFKHTLRSVVFGIILLIAIAAYVAIGSGLPGVREYFELDELGFFNAWPLKVLTILMVATLTTVTIQRIPFTRPRYGVWMVHIGIITLIGGMGWYYGHKIEGSALLLQDRSTSRFYDRYERALYFQAGGFVSRVALTSLPRFHSYSADLHNADYLDRSDLENLTPMVGRQDPNGGATQFVTAAEAVGAKSLSFTITGYWPYASIRQSLLEDPASDKVGFAFPLADFGDTEPRDRLVCSAIRQFNRVNWGSLDIEDRALADQQAIDQLIQAAHDMHQLTISVGGVTQRIAVEVGQTYTLGQTGYSLHIESFNPQWETIDHKIVPKLTFIVTSPTQTFRRMLLSDLDRPTDFKLGAGAPGEAMGPMGKRQKELLDKSLVTTYTYHDHDQFLPENGLGKLIFLTTPGSAKTTVLSVEANQPPSVQTFEGKTAQVTLYTPTTEEATIMAFAGQPQPREATALKVTRSDHVAGQKPYVQEVPKALRNRDEGSSGRRQVVSVRFQGIDSTDKSFSGDVLVPFSEHPFESPWQGGLVNVPNAATVAQIQLGNNYRTLPAVVKLDKLEAIAYAGMDPALGATIRDYRSTITLTDPRTGKTRTDTVFLNSPVFYDGNNWIFFQSQFDVEGQRWSVLGVGNRPGTYVMTAGCVLIIVGIFYAFYIKPLVIKRMKRQALASAKAKQVELV